MTGLPTRCPAAHNNNNNNKATEQRTDTKCSPLTVLKELCSQNVLFLIIYKRRCLCDVDTGE